jgi:hypothetical protein
VDGVGADEGPAGVDEMESDLRWLAMSYKGGNWTDSVYL